MGKQCIEKKQVFIKNNVMLFANSKKGFRTFWPKQRKKVFKEKIKK